jgi:excisionase family DNA binding protein
MTTLTIRQASEVVGRAPATIRRYIKSGRLPAAKDQGKFGEEFRIRMEDLQGLGLARAESPAPLSVAPSPNTELPVRWVPAPPAEAGIPRDLYAELVMKHERLLVQYGMVRASGVKLLEARADLEAKDSLLAEREREIREIKERSEREIGFLQSHLRQAEIEIEDRNIEIALLQDKLRRLEISAAGAEAVRSFDEEVRTIQDRGGRPVDPLAAAPKLPDIRKIDALEDWLRACQSDTERESS